MISSSDNFTICRDDGIVPSSAFAAMSRMDLILAKENPHARICASVTFAKSSGRGNFLPGKNFLNRVKMLFAAVPLSCWCATACTSD